MPVQRPLLDDDPPEVGGWHLTSRIGEGGMGVVYLAKKDQQQAALKLIRPELASDRSFRNRFRREVEAVRSVQGRRTARFIDSDPNADRPWLATEYVDGPSLSEAIEDSGPLDPAATLALGTALADALASMHDRGVIHRDLKPSNVLLAEESPVVIDFGIAAASEATSMTRTGTVLGSTGWMAPEQAAADRVTPAADIFSWGALVAYAASGVPPFGEGRPEALLYRVVHDEPNLVIEDRQLRRLVKRCLAKDPAARPQAAEVLGVLTGEKTNLDQAATRIIEATWVDHSTRAMAPPAPPARVPVQRPPRRLALAGSLLTLVALVATIGLVLANMRSGADAAAGTAPMTEPAPSTTSTTVAPTTTTTAAPATTAPPPTTPPTTAAPVASTPTTIPWETPPPPTPPTPGGNCTVGSWYDCIDPDGDGWGVYLINGGNCMATMPDSPGLCSDLDRDGYAGYPDTG